MEVLKLDHDRRTVCGDVRLLNEKIGKGADIRIKTLFKHNEHVDIHSEDDQMVEETSYFPQTVLIDGSWSAYFMTLRQPVAIPDGFGHENALSLFLYNQDGTQAAARLSMDNSADETLIKDTEDHGFKKMHTMMINDPGTYGVSMNFIYDFDSYTFYADDRYEDLGSDIDRISEAYGEGRSIKVGIKGINDALWGRNELEEEIFIHCSSSYYYTRSKSMVVNTQPFVSVPSCIPLIYKPKSFRYCWAILRSDQKARIRSFDPVKRLWKTVGTELCIRWFAKRK